MKNLVIGFIGAGNIGSALINGVTNSETFSTNKILVYDINPQAVSSICNNSQIVAEKTLGDLITKSDIIFIAVKPHHVNQVLKKNTNYFTKDKIIISIAVSIPISYYEKVLSKESKIVRAMPNTPALIHEGMTLICSNKNVLENELDVVMKLFSSVGMVDTIPENLMCEITSVTASSPAYVFMLIEAMADAAVLSGIPRDKAYKMSAQAVAGAAKLLLKTNTNPSVLKDQVCSPGGTTIEALKVLEKHSFRYAIMDAMHTCTNKAIDIANRFQIDEEEH